MSAMVVFFVGGMCPEGANVSRQMPGHANRTIWDTRPLRRKTANNSSLTAVPYDPFINLMFFITDANDHTGLGHEDGGAIMPRTRRILQKRQYSTAVPSARHHLSALPVYGMRSRVYVTVRCPSVFLFQQGPQQQTRLYGFAAAGQCRQKISIACCTAGAQQQRRVAGEWGQCGVVT